MDSRNLSQLVTRSLPDLPNELLLIIADILGHDFSTLASLAATCPLHFAAVANQVAAAELLIKAGAGFRERSFGLCSMSEHGEACAHSLESCPNEFFPMHTAVCYGHKDMIKLFLSRGADAFYIADSPEDASDNPDDGLPEDGEELESVQGVEEEEPPENPEWVQPGRDEPDDDPGTPHATALHIAASLGRGDLVEFFAGKSGISMNATACDGHTPLHYAAHAMLKHPRAVIRKLVQMGARLDARYDIEFELLIRSVVGGRCAVAVDLLHLRAYTHLTAEQLDYLLHAALTPAAFYSFERGISIANLSSASYSRRSVILPRSYRDSYDTVFPDFTSDCNMDLLERQELVRLLVKEFGVDVNRVLPDITKINGNGDTAIHCAMKLYAREWKTLELTRVYHRLESWNQWEETSVDRSPDSMLHFLLTAWPGDKFNAVDKNERRYIDLASFINRLPSDYCYEGIIPARMPQIVGFIEMTMRLQFVESLFGVGRTDDANLVWGETQGKEKILKIVIARLTEIRRKLKMGSREQFLMGAFHTFPNFSGVWLRE
ncbi:ankyrin repeat-containing domain protein [Neurospora hispaniola]|uniref:Ankyrin repeat-containing domain protein n=1 Tax=Neurospora hispaniola TaxID=588809 RepID=A0AAJ0MV82_9PEZI|nr:ankyrin repeat-containing domain protein [Neurospora hispaniola]